MSKARCENCGGFAPLTFDRHGRSTCPVCGAGEHERRGLPGKPVALALLVGLIALVGLAGYAVARVCFTLGRML